MAERPAFVTLDDYEPVARQQLPADVYAFIAGGAGDEWTLDENRRAFDRLLLRPRMLRGAGSPDPSTNVLGTPVSFPVVVAPWAYQRLVHPGGEVATARAAAAAGTLMVVSSTAYGSLEEIAEAAGHSWWQLYVLEDRGLTEEVLARVVRARFEAVCLTVDLSAYGLRHRETRHGFEPAFGTHGTSQRFDLQLTWDDLGWVRDRIGGLPLLLKGILTAEDARLAVEHGVDGIVVSNHGGRQLDGVPAGITALPEVVEAVAGRVPVLVDGGVRRGTDVLRALALGAVAVLVGRPLAWGLAVDGEAGVREVLRILRDEFENAMALAGCRTIAEITPSLVAHAEP